MKSKIIFIIFFVVYLANINAQKNLFVNCSNDNLLKEPLISGILNKKGLGVEKNDLGKSVYIEIVDFVVDTMINTVNLRTRKDEFILYIQSQKSFYTIGYRNNKLSVTQSLDSSRFESLNYLFSYTEPTKANCYAVLNLFPNTLYQNLNKLLFGVVFREFSCFL